MKILIILLSLFLSTQLAGGSNQAENETEINVEYYPDAKCKTCSNWILIKGNYKTFDRNKAKRIYIQNKNNLNKNELDYLAEKQKPLILKLKGSFLKTKEGESPIFNYSEYTVVEF